MRNNFCCRLVLCVMLSFLSGMKVQAEHHRATHLGSPATRFAPPMQTPDDLRERFQNPRLREDFAAVLRQAGWQGNLDDFFAAGLTNEIVAWQIPVGDVMPFMSSRENNKPVCLRNVLWAGKKPISAYSFKFTSNGRIYRCIIPKPCSNFFVVDLGPEPVAGLAINCNVPDRIFAGRKARVYLDIHNIGNISEPEATVSLPVPANSYVTATTDGGMVTNGSVQWEIANLPANASKEVCAVFQSRQPGTLAFRSSVRSARVAPVESSCETEVDGVPAILLEKADNPDPVAVGDTTTYTVRVTNQGDIDDSNVQVIVTIAPELVPISASAGTINGQIVTLPSVPKLAGKQAVTYTIVVKGVKPGDGHTRFDLSSEMLRSSIYAEESTTVY